MQALETIPPSTTAVVTTTWGIVGFIGNSITERHTVTRTPGSDCKPEGKHSEMHFSAGLLIELLLSNFQKAMITWRAWLKCQRGLQPSKARAFEQSSLR